MKEKEVRELAICAVCKNHVSKAAPSFYKVKLQRFMYDGVAIKRQVGLEMMLGSVALAQVMGADEDMAQEISEESIISICESCMTGNIENLGEIVNLINDNKGEKQ